MEKKYRTISPVPKTDNLIYECFELLTEADRKKFVKKFKAQAKIEEANHTLRELILGAFVARQGFEPEYEPEIEGRTPEWLMTHRESGKRMILELTNFHAREKLEKEMRKALNNGESYAYWMEPNDDRLYGRLQEKMAKYRDDVEKHGLHYVVAVFGLFSSALCSADVKACLEGPAGLFQQYPWVTGVLFFYAAGSEYWFEYHPNPHAVRKAIQINAGSVPVKPVEG